MIAFGERAGVKEIAAQLPILTLGNEIMVEGARDLVTLTRCDSANGRGFSGQSTPRS
jgi:hypothetical protein